MTIFLEFGMVQRLRDVIHLVVFDQKLFGLLNSTGQFTKLKIVIGGNDKSRWRPIAEGIFDNSNNLLDFLLCNRSLKSFTTAVHI